MRRILWDVFLRLGDRAHRSEMSSCGHHVDDSILYVDLFRELFGRWGNSSRVDQAFDVGLKSTENAN
jgi:hypothetical protein